MKKLMALVLCLGGCMSVSAEPLSPGVYAIKAEGTGFQAKNTMSAAYKEAYRVCPQGFDVEDGESSRSSVPISDGSSETSCRGNVYGATCRSRSYAPMQMATGERTMIIRCRGAGYDHNACGCSGSMCPPCR